MVVVLVLVLVVLVAGGTLALALAIRYGGKRQQAAYDADVAQFVADLHTPDPQVAARQAEIERNLADADALEARVEAQEAAAPPPPPPRAEDRDPLPPDPTL
jgi:hypothetical protein